MSETRRVLSELTDAELDQVAGGQVVKPPTHLPTGGTPQPTGGTLGLVHRSVPIEITPHEIKIIAADLNN